MASRNEEEHREHLRLLFERLSKYGVVINPAEWVFGEREVSFLGYKVCSDGIAPLSEKIQVICGFPQPKTSKEPRQFLGMINFSRVCMPKAAITQAPLTDMLCGDLKGKAPINWTPAALVAFTKSKEDLAQAKLIAHPRSDARIARVCDDSDIAAGAALQQRVANTWEPLGFFSKKFTPAENKYSAFDRELLTIYLDVKYFQHIATSISTLEFHWPIYHRH